MIICKYRIKTKCGVGMSDNDLKTHLNRRLFIGSALASAGAGIMAGAAPVLAASDQTTSSSELDHSTVIEDGGKYSQTWFLDSFLELADDLEETASNGKRLAVIWEQKGCPYCRETHLVNFSTPKIRDWIRERFEIIQLDIYGSREVVDFDGETLEERSLAGKARVMFTPTMQFFPPTLDQVAGKGGVDAEVFRMPGYFKRFHFITVFEYVHDKVYEEMDFQRYLAAKVARLQEEGKEFNVW